MRFALRAARLFDGEQLVADPVLAVDGTTILAVGADVPPELDVQDLGDVTLLPGLVDTHQHLCLDGSGPLEQQVAGVTDDELLERSRGNALRALGAGITTIRDLGDRDFVTLPLRDEPGLPTILCAGPPLTRDAGHCWYLGGCCEGRDALVAAVRDRHDRGCDVVKIMVTGGAKTAGFEVWDTQFDVDEVRSVVDTAHELGLPVAAHCHATEGIAIAVEARVDTIEHCTFFTRQGRSQPDADVIAAVAAAGVTVSATLGRDITLPAPPLIEANLDVILSGLQQLHAAGAVVVVGTDAGIGPPKPHDILPHAARDLVAIGMDGLEVLAALTSNAARACGVGDRKGRVAAGYDADLVAVAGDPVRSHDALLDVRAVWARGAAVG